MHVSRCMLCGYCYDEWPLWKPVAVAVAAMSNQGVCIVHEQSINQPGLVETDCLSKAGYSVRISGNCLPDLIISKAGTTAAYLLVSNQVALSGSDIWNR